MSSSNTLLELLVNTVDTNMGVLCKRGIIFCETEGQKSEFCVSASALCQVFVAACQHHKGVAEIVTHSAD